MRFPNSRNAKSSKRGVNRITFSMNWPQYRVIDPLRHFVFESSFLPAGTAKHAGQWIWKFKSEGRGGGSDNHMKSSEFQLAYIEHWQKRTTVVGRFNWQGVPNKTDCSCKLSFPSKIKCFLHFRVPGASIGKLRGRSSTNIIVDWLMDYTESGRISTI